MQTCKKVIPYLNGWCGSFHYESRIYCIILLTLNENEIKSVIANVKTAEMEASLNYRLRLKLQDSSFLISQCSVFSPY